jgi:16S rRNA processing protein RimM
MPRPDWVEVGRVQRAHGIQGEVRVASSTDNPDRFVPGETVYARDARPGVIRARRAASAPSDDDRLPLEIEDARGTYENPIIAFVGIDTREQAEGLRGFVLEVPGDQLPDLDDGEYYLCDLEGLEVRAAPAAVATDPGHTDLSTRTANASQRVGVVTEAIEGVTHDILALRLDADGREVLVPFIEEAVPEVEMAAGYLVVDPAFLLPALDA